MKFRAKAKSPLQYGPFAPLAAFHQFIGQPGAESEASVKLMANGLLAPHLQARKADLYIDEVVEELEMTAITEPEAAPIRRLLATRVCRLLVATGASTLPFAERQQTLTQTYRFMRGKYEDSMPKHSHENVTDSLRKAYQDDFDILKKNATRSNPRMRAAYNALSWSGLFGYMASGLPLTRKK